MFRIQKIPKADEILNIYLAMKLIYQIYYLYSVVQNVPCRTILLLPAFMVIFKLSYNNIISKAGTNYKGNRQKLVLWWGVHPKTLFSHLSSFHSLKILFSGDNSVLVLRIEF